VGMYKSFIIQIPLCVHEEEIFNLLHPQDERRRIGTPTARARVCYNLFDSLAFHFLSCVVTNQQIFLCFHPTGYNGVWLRQKGTDSSRSCIPVARRGQTGSAATQAETHQLHTAGEPGHNTFLLITRRAT